MTETVAPARPRIAGARRPRPEFGASGSAVLAGALAAAGAAVLGLLAVAVPVLLVWWAEDRSGTDVGDAVRAGAQAWLVAHGAALELPQGRLGLTPLGLVVLPAALLWRAGRRVGQASAGRGLRGAAQATVVVAVPYAAVAGVVATVASSDTVRPLPLAALGWSLLLALAASGAGAVRAAGAGPRLRALVPRPARVPLLAAAVSALVLLGAAGVLAAAALALDGGRAAELAEATAPGAVGGLGLLSVGVALAPNVVVWAACWLAGPGFAVGAGTAVSPFDVVVGPLPALPLTAALPSAAPPGVVAVLVLLTPVLAGAAGGRVLHRRVGADEPLPRVVAWAGASGVAAGVLLGGLAALSGGPVGADRMAELGPSPWPVAAAVAAEVAAGTLAAVLWLRRRGRPGPLSP